MGRAISLRGPDHRKIISILAEVRKELGNFNARLPAGLEIKGRALELPLAFLADSLSRLEIILLTMALPQRRLRIKGIHVAGPSHHEEEDTVLGLGRKMSGRSNLSSLHSIPRQHPGHRGSKKTIPRLPQEFPASPSAGEMKWGGGRLHGS